MPPRKIAARRPDARVRGQGGRRSSFRQVSSTEQRLVARSEHATVSALRIPASAVFTGY